MLKKIISWKTKGMNRDLSVSAFNPEFSFENRNLRLSTNENNTLMSWVNEKGPLKIPVSITTPWAENPTIESTILGIPIGTAIIGHKLVLFTTLIWSVSTLPSDYIYVFEYTEDKEGLNGTILYRGHLGFDYKSPLETLVSYEAEHILKVYWTDGVNLPRVINIAVDNITLKKWNHNGEVSTKIDTFFDFVPTLALNETIKVLKYIGSGGTFAPGVIQYAFTYHNKYGLETTIFHTTSLYYISFSDRGGSPEEKVDNTFTISIENFDTNFDYLRIYSIHRSSLNGTPFVKHVTDIYLGDLDETEIITYTDTGRSGSSIDPTELLYKGGETISALTMEQKDGTLFLGNIKILGNTIDLFKDDIKKDITISAFERKFHVPLNYFSGYIYGNLLNATSESLNVPCATFKRGNYYRLGVLFQHESGKWSEPIPIEDLSHTKSPHLLKIESTSITMSGGCFQGRISKGIAQTLYKNGYKRVRGVVVYPEPNDRNVICQGVVSNVLGTENQSYVQPSWFFRPYVADWVKDDSNWKKWQDDLRNKELNDSYHSYDLMREHLLFLDNDGSVSPAYVTGYLPYTSYQIMEDEPVKGAKTYMAHNIRNVEIQGEYETSDQFTIIGGVYTLHSPDIAFEDYTSNRGDMLSASGWRRIKDASITYTMSDIDILTETPTISLDGGGFVHKSFKKDTSLGIVAGLFYDDYMVDGGDELRGFSSQLSSAKWMVYPWHMTGSLNNDINRPVNKGTASAILKKKVISNLRYAKNSAIIPDDKNADETYRDPRRVDGKFRSKPQIFSSNEISLIKLSEKPYEGNIDTVLTPTYSDGLYFAYNGVAVNERDIKFITKEYYYIDMTQVKRATPFTSDRWCKTWSKDVNNPSHSGLYVLFRPEKQKEDTPNKTNWHWSWCYGNTEIGKTYIDLVLKKPSVRMKYKSTPHIVFESLENPMEMLGSSKWSVPIIEITQDTNGKTRFGGEINNKSALRENVWIPCGEPVRLDNYIDNSYVYYDYSWGDTYYQRYDCLKTYPFTPEDINLIVEIGSFMLETYINIDGRYDRNRALLNNLNMTPLNFNLINPVYSLLNNFFSYKITSDEEDTLIYPNQIVWSKTKSSSAETDLWTDITLSSVMELDGNKGKLNSLLRFDNQLIAFLDTGISLILYNENVLLSSTEGVPIEIANSGKVLGKRYISNTVGCSNKYSIVNAPTGIYFMDSYNKAICLFNGQITNISSNLGFNTWAKNNIPTPQTKWNSTNFNDFVGYYDKLNQDVLFVNVTEALAYSEKLSTFTSFYDYGKTPYFCNLDDTGIWIGLSKITNDLGKQTDTTYYFWKHNAGSYCDFFGTEKPYSTTLIGNLEPLLDKTFTNLEFRACVDTDYMEKDNRIVPLLPFDYLEVWNEHLHGITTLENKRGHEAMVHHMDDTSALKRKFRIWRSDIPRDNAPINHDEEAEKGIYRYSKHPMNRMRNPWLYLKLEKLSDTNKRTEIHDITMTYFT